MKMAATRKSVTLNLTLNEAIAVRAAMESRIDILEGRIINEPVENVGMKAEIAREMDALKNVLMIM